MFKLLQVLMIMSLSTAYAGETTYSGTVSGKTVVSQEELEECYSRTGNLSVCSKMLHAQKRKEMVSNPKKVKKQSAQRHIASKPQEVQKVTSQNSTHAFSGTYSGDPKVSEKELNDCIAKSGDFSSCKQMLKALKRKEAVAKDSRAATKPEIRVKEEEKVNPNCPFKKKAHCAAYSKTVGKCIEIGTRAAYECRNIAKKIVTKVYSEDISEEEDKKQLEEFAYFKKCVAEKKMDKSECMQYAKKMVDSPQEDSSCNLAGQQQGECNGFLYKRSDSVVNDISRHVSGNTKNVSSDPFGELDAEMDSGFQQ